MNKFKSDSTPTRNGTAKIDQQFTDSYEAQIHDTSTSMKQVWY